MIVVGKIVNGADVKFGARPDVHRLGSLVIYFRAYVQFFGHLTLEQPAFIPPVVIAGSGVNPVTAAAVGCPWAKAFLQPHGEESLQMAGAQAGFSIAGWNFKERENADLRAIRGFLEETIFYAEFGIAITKMGRALGRGVK